MAVTITCDGCGKITDKAHMDFTTSGKDNAGNLVYGFGPFDVCDTCQALLKKVSDVTQWSTAPKKQPPPPVSPIPSDLIPAVAAVSQPQEASSSIGAHP
jgi:hypothetical protein